MSHSCELDPGFGLKMRVLTADILSERFLEMLSFSIWTFHDIISARQVLVGHYRFASVML
jgi:hypothetical protein